MTPVRDVKRTQASKSTQGKTNRGRRKAPVSSKTNRRRQTAETDSESDHEPPSEMKMRLPRRAKTAALQKSKLNLAEFLNEDPS